MDREVSIFLIVKIVKNALVLDKIGKIAEKLL